MKKVINGLIYLLFIVFIARFCFFDIFRIPSDSMKNTLNRGDLIITNKTLYSGTFSWLFNKLNIKASPKLNDILVFRINQSDSTFFVKRCIGLPGKTIEIRNGKILIDKAYINEPTTTLHLYKLWYTNYSLIESTLNNSNIDLFTNGFRRLPRYIVLNLDIARKTALLNKSAIDSITLFGINEYNNHSSDSLPYGKIVQNLKPILLPFAGMKIKLNSTTFTLYKNILKAKENVRIEQNGGNFYVDGTKSEYYVFKKSYYFMMGDNREDSIDSRSFGPISQECIEGKLILTI